MRWNCISDSQYGIMIFSPLYYSVDGTVGAETRVLAEMPKEEVTRERPYPAVHSLLDEWDIVHATLGTESILPMQQNPRFALSLHLKKSEQEEMPWNVSIHVRNHKRVRCRLHPQRTRMVATNWIIEH